MNSSEMDTKQCPSCGSQAIDSDSGVAGAICEGCGLVHDGETWASDVADNIVDEPQDNQSRTNSDWHEEVTITDASDRQLVTILSNVDDVSEELKLSSEQRNQAAEIVTEAWTRNLMHGRELQGMIAASVYIACRKSGEPIPTNAVVDTVESTEARFQNAYRVLIDELDPKVTPPEPSGYLPYLGTELEASEAVIEHAGELAKIAHVGGNPAGIAVAAIYIASRESTEEITLSEAGDVAGVAKETVWRHSQQIREAQNIS